MQLALHPLSLTDLGIGDSGTIRDPGLHASDIFNDLYQDLEPGRYQKDRTPPPLLLEIGLIFETMLEEGLLRKLSREDPDVRRPGELIHEDTFDGYPIHLAYSPDLIISNGELRVGEIKATKMSPGVPADVIAAYLEGDAEAQAQVEAIPLSGKFDKYHTQIKLYAKMLGTRLGRLYTFFINGTWRPTADPVFLVWDIEYTQDELDQNYAMLMYHAIHKGLIR